VTPILRVLLLAALFAPGLALAQSFTVNGPFDPGRYAPLDGHERFVRWWSEDGGSSSIHLTALLDASVTQVGRGASSYGSNLVQNTTHEGLAYAMGTDTRYFACNCRGFLPRSGHVLQMTLLTYNMSGHKTLDIPQLAGAYGGPMVATMWWPRHYAPLVQGVQVGHLEIGLIGTIHMVQEFAPELKHFFLWRSRDD
jgi:hypothetical protein